MKQLKNIRVLSLFSGIGAFEKGLKNLGVNYELVNYCEINEHASKCYSLIHNVSEDKNLWDVTKVDGTKIENIDILTHGSPCQDISSAGKQLGADEGSGTRSSLLWESVRIIKECKPKFIIWENVKNALSPKHKHNVEKYIEELNKIGYKSYLPEKGYLSAKDFNIPQSRERVFVVSVLNEEKEFIFPKGESLKRDLKEFLDFREKDNITESFFNRYKEIVNKNATLEEFVEYINNLPITKGIGTKKLKLYSYNEMNTITTCEGLTGTLCCRSVQNYCKKFWYNNNLYKPSPRMCFRLMGFLDEDFDKVEKIGSDSQLWDRAGNSIVVNVAQAILKEILQQYNYVDFDK